LHLNLLFANDINLMPQTPEKIKTANQDMAALLISAVNGLW